MTYRKKIKEQSYKPKINSTHRILRVTKFEIKFMSRMKTIPSEGKDCFSSCQIGCRVYSVKKHEFSGHTFGSLAAMYAVQCMQHLANITSRVNF